MDKLTATNCKYIEEVDGFFRFVDHDSYVVECYLSLINGIISEQDMTKKMGIPKEALEEMRDLLSGKPELIADYMRAIS